jgi:hypothetical protein
MATVTTEKLTDDLDPRIESGVETVVFYDPMTGDKLEIELGEANQKHLANHIEKLKKYVDVARQVEVASKPVSKSAKAKSDTDKIREWARDNGYTVGDRGRIKKEILDAYEASQFTTKVTSADTQPEVKVVTEVDEPSAEELAEIEELADEMREVTEDEFIALLAKNPNADLAELRELAKAEQN